MRFILLTVALFSFLTPNLAFSDELNSEKKIAIKQLLEITEAMKIGALFADAFLQQITQALKQSKPDIDPKAFEIIESEVNNVINEELVEKESLLPHMIPIYHKHLSLEEINGLIQFYQTPLGKKALNAMPQMMQEGMQAGQVWGQSVGQKIHERLMERFKKEGVEI
jgi:uncharacterized protein